MSQQEDSARVLDRCRDLGFARAGICDAQPSEFGEFFRDWLAAGRHGEMAYLERLADLRIDPNAMLPGVRSIICVADWYSNGERDVRSDDDDQASGRIARYARGADYHKHMLRRLNLLCRELRERHPGESFRACVDTAPVFEREHAQRAGIGAIGKHTLLIDRGIGSYLFLGEVLSTVRLAPSSPAEPDPCGTCTRCIDACPTEAITPWSVDATKCISYLTIEHRSAIDETHHEAMSDWIFGCDVCQEVCPHNQETDRSRAQPVNEAYRARRRNLDLVDVLNWSEDDRRASFRGSAMKRAKLHMMKRNALIAAGNLARATGSEALRRAIRALADDPDENEIVREAAQHVASLDATSAVD